MSKSCDVSYTDDAQRILDEMADQYDLEFLAEANGGACARRQVSILRLYRRYDILPPFPRAAKPKRKAK